MKIASANHLNFVSVFHTERGVRNHVRLMNIGLSGYFLLFEEGLWVVDMRSGGPGFSRVCVTKEQIIHFQVSGVWSFTGSGRKVNFSNYQVEKVVTQWA